MIKLPNVRLKKNRVPILSNDAIESDVEFLIEQYDSSLLEKPGVLDIENFIEELGLSIQFDDLSCNKSILGRMIFDNRKITTYDSKKHDIKDTFIDANTVLVDNSALEDENFLRSIMAHECIHGVYHRELYTVNANQLSLFPIDREQDLSMNACRVKDIKEGKKELVTPRDWAEHHAKYGGATLLMNRKALIKAYGNPEWREAFFRENYENVGFANASLAMLISRTCGTSLTSAEIRIKTLGLNFTKEKPLKIKIA